MTANTKMKSLTNAWEQVSVDGASQCTVTLEGGRGRNAVVRVDMEAPAAGETEGITLTALSPNYSVPDLSSAQKVYARAFNGAARVALH